MDPTFEDMEADQIRGLYNGLNVKFEEFRGLFANMLSEMNGMKKVIQKLEEEKSQLLAQKSELLADNETKTLEVEVLQTEINTVNEEKEMIRTELMEVRNENDILISQLNKKDSMLEHAQQLAKILIPHHSVNGIVNSLPAFSEQMVLTDRPNSLNTFGSLVDMEGLRLRPSESKEDTYHSTRLASGQTSNETYYDAIGSHRSSLTNGSTGVRPKVQQNQVSSTVPAMTTVPNVNDIRVLNEVLNDSLTGLSVSTNYYIDEHNNLQLKLVKVPIGRLMTVSMAFNTSPSDFWLHINPRDVDDFFHLIQVKQNELKSEPNSNLTAADVELGMYCAAIYSLDGYWYRAQVIHITYDHPIERDSIKSVLVLFIDWGNTEERPLSSLMKLSLELNKRKQAINCYIQGSSHKSKLPENITKEFVSLLKDNKLKATFNRPHKLDERLKSVVYPIDLMYESDNGSLVNLYEFLAFPQSEEEFNETIEIDQTLVCPSETQKEKSADTVICNGLLSGHSNPTLSPNNSKSDPKNKCLENQSKSKSNQNCATNNPMSNGVSETPIRFPKSMPHLNSLASNPSDAKLSEIRIPPPIIPETNDGLIVQASHPETPSYIYIHISDTQVGSAQFEDLEEQLNSFYSKDRPHVVTQPEDVKVGSFWVTCFRRDNRWYRCRVLRLSSNGKARINYVDWGNEEWVDIKNLMPLSRQLAIYPAMAVRCRLSNVLPYESEEWSEDALMYFNELVASEDTPPLTAFIAHKPTAFDFDSYLDVFLWTNDANNEDILINLQLVVKNYASTDNQEWVTEAERGLREKTPPELMSELIPIINNVNSEAIKMVKSSTATPIVKSGLPLTTTIIRCTPEDNGVQEPTSTSDLPNGCTPKISKSTNVKVLPELPDYEDDEWDPMGEDANSDRNNYNFNPNDAILSTLGFRPQNRMVCKYFGTSSGCRAKDYCSFLHVAPEKRFALDDTEEENFFLPELDLPIDSVVLLKVTTITNPYDFYGVFPFGPLDLSQIELSDDSPQDKELKDMSISLKKHYSNSKKKENVNIFPGNGTLVAFRDESSDSYYRGRVIDGDYENNICTIFCIDLGIEMDVKRNHVFKLTNYFCEMPALAIQCSLTNIQSVDTLGWSQQSINVFTECLFEKLVCARIMYGKVEGKHFVDIFYKEDDLEINLSEKLVELQIAQRIHTSPASLDLSDEIYNSDLD